MTYENYNLGEGPDLNARVGHRFGTSPYFIIVDTQTMAFEAVPNPAADNQQGGAGVTAVMLAIGKDVNAVLTGYCSPTIYAWYPLLCSKICMKKELRIC